MICVTSASIETIVLGSNPAATSRPRLVRSCQLDHAIDRRLRVDLRVVLLDRARDDTFIALGVPVDAEAPVEQMVDSEGSLDHAEWPFDAAPGKEQRVHGTER